MLVNTGAGCAVLQRLAYLAACVALVSCSREPRIPKTAARPPMTRVAPVTDTLHGVQVVDNYRWLEGDNTDPKDLGKMTPEVAAWTEAQNGYTRAVLDNLPGRKALEDHLRALMKTGSVTVPVMRGNRYFYANRAAAEGQPIIYWREGYLGADKALLDPAEIDSSGRTSVVWFSPSEDGTLVAYGTYHEGDDSPTLHLREVDSAKSLPLEIPNTPQGVQWLPDASGFVYQQLKNAKEPSSSQAVFHRMKSSPSASDVVLYRGPSGTLSRDGHWLLIGAWTGPKSNNLWLADFEAVRKGGRLTPKVVSLGTDGVASGTVIDGTVFLHTTKGAPQGRVVAVPATDPGHAHWRDVVPERSDATIENVALGRGRIAVSYQKNASTVIEVFDFNGKSLGPLTQPGLGAAAVAAGEDRTEAFLTFTSFNYPPTVFRIDLMKPNAAPKLWVAPDFPVDPAMVDVEQVWYPSKDGTKISMFLAHKHGLSRAGNAPTLVAGYGGFGASMTPTFSATLFQWFEAGGVFAVPNLRGGGEYGEAWHQAGMLDKKPHTFDDFVAAADWLIANRYTNPAKLAIFGGANGGLVVGAAMTQRPELFRAAVMLVPVLDMLRYENFLSGRDWAPEYGVAGDPRQFMWLTTYSPYQLVKRGMKYPGVLLTALENDTPVHASHARKMAAALQAASASDAAECPVLLRVDRHDAQTADAVLAQQIRDLVDQRIFVMWQLGML